MIMGVNVKQRTVSIARPPKGPGIEFVDIGTPERVAEWRRAQANAEAERRRLARHNKKQAKSLTLQTPPCVFWSMFCKLDEENFGEITNNWSEIIDRVEHDDKLGFVVPATSKETVPFRVVGWGGEIVCPSKKVMNLVLKSIYLDFLSLWTPTIKEQYMDALDNETDQSLYWKILD
jgi:hypothetical protein